MNLAVYGIALYEGIVPAARLTSHYQGGQTAFASELDSWRLARIAGYSGFVPVLGMRCLDLAVPPAADLDIVTGATDTSGQVVSAYFTNIAASTLAAMFTNGAGTLIYRRRLEWYDRPVPQWAAGEGGTALALTGVAINSNTLNQVPSVAGWTAGNSATLTSSGISGVNPLFYPYCGLMHGNGSTANPQVSFGSATATPVTPGDWYGFSAWLYSPQGYATGISVQLLFKTSGGSTISTITTGAVPLAAAGITWLQIATSQAPATAAWAELLIQASGTPASTVLFYMAGAAMVQVPVVAAGGNGATAPEAPYLDDAKLSSDRAQLYNQAVLTQYGTNLVSSFSGTGVLFTPSSGVVVIIENEHVDRAARRGALHRDPVPEQHRPGAAVLPGPAVDGGLRQLGHPDPRAAAVPAAEHHPDPGGHPAGHADGPRRRSRRHRHVPAAAARHPRDADRHLRLQAQPRDRHRRGPAEVGRQVRAVPGPAGQRPGVRRRDPRLPDRRQPARLVAA